MTAPQKDTDSLGDELHAIVGEATNQWDDGIDYDTPAVEKLKALIKSENNRVLQTVLELPPAHLIGSNGRRSEYIKTSDVQDLIHRIMEG